MVERSLSVLEDRNQSLIVPVRTNSGLKGQRNIVIDTEYEITKKGEKYLEMATKDYWEPYQKLYGAAGPSLRRLL